MIYPASEVDLPGYVKNNAKHKQDFTRTAKSKDLPANNDFSTPINMHTVAFTQNILSGKSYQLFQPSKSFETIILHRKTFLLYFFIYVLNF